MKRQAHFGWNATNIKLIFEKKIHNFCGFDLTNVGIYPGQWTLTNYKFQRGI